MRSLAKIFIALGLLGALLVLGRGLYYAPNNESTELMPVATVEAAGTEDTAHTLPERLLIPRLNIDASVQHLGITKSGDMAAPNNFVDVSWYKFGTVPGDVGSAVIAGHEDNALALDGVFKHLEDLELGDDVYVTTEGGARLRFKVVDKKIYPYNLTGPELEKVFTRADKARLNLITCAGKWLAEAHTNDQRLVIYTELVP